MVAWKLCDREFDCDNCPLDRALRGDTTAIDADASPAGRRSDWPVDRRYHRTHLWAADVGDGRVRCGLDHVVARLLAPGGSLVLPAAGQSLHGGRIGFWMLHECGPVPLRAPVGGRVVARNSRLAADPSLSVTRPFDDGWLVEVEADPTELTALLDAAAAEALAADQFGRLRHKLTAGGVDGPPATMTDGGEPAPGLWRAIGRRRWRRLVLPLLE